MLKFNSSCECCAQNQKIFADKKLKRKIQQKNYYQENREEIILRNLKNYYSRQEK